MRSLYKEHIPKQKIKIKSLKYFCNPWVTAGITNSSNRKQNLYEKFLKIRAVLMKRHIKTRHTNVKNLSLSELKEASFSMKINKSARL